jgi:hypothetical protein
LSALADLALEALAEMEVHMPLASSIPTPQIRALTADETDAVTGARMSVGAALAALGKALTTSSSR